MIRKAEIADTNAVAEIFAQLHNKHIEIRGDFFNNISDEDFLNETRSLIEGDCDLIVCEEDSVIKGYALVNYVVQNNFFLNVPERCFVDQLAVKDEFRRQGIGAKLMEYISEQARERGCVSVELDVWYENYDAVDFYATLDFRPRKLRLERAI